MQSMDPRADLIHRLTFTLKSEPWVIAAWLGGSDANGRTDRWSDIDLLVLVEDDRVEDTFATCEAAARRVAPISLALRLPTPTWHGHDQAFWQLEGLPDWCMIDLVVLRRSATGSRFLETERHGAAHVLFDREGVVRPASFDREAHGARVKERLDTMIPRFRLLQHLVRKATWRGGAAEAADRYLSFTLRPLVELLRIRHCPDRFDFGMRYLRDDLPDAAWREVDGLSLPGSLDAVREAQARAEIIFEREVAALMQQDPHAPDA